MKPATKRKFEQTEVGKPPKPTLDDKKHSTIGDYFTLQRGTTYESRLLGKPGPILLGLASIHRNGGFRGDSLQTYGGDSPQKLLVKPGEIYVSLKDVTQSADLLGAVARLPYGSPVGRLTQDTVKLEPRSNDVPLDYLYWLLRTPQYRAYCRARCTGTTNLGLSREDFLAFPAPEPTSEQLLLAEMLGKLDQKIELNQQIDQTLETIGKGLFKRWFVDFEFPDEEGKPYKSSGGGMTYNEESNSDIPEGWKVKPIDEVADFLNGLAMQKFPAREGEEFLPVIKIKELRGGITESSDKANLNVPKEYVVSDGDVLFSWSGSLEVVIWGFGKGALNQHLFKVTSKKYPKWFFYYWVLQFLPEYRAIASGKATTMGHIQRHHLSASKVLVPDDKSLEKMDKVLDPIIERKVKLQVESGLLSEIRDSLLPKLMSGKIRIPVLKENREVS
jgi:type I restriction enzyme S subunit